MTLRQAAPEESSPTESAAAAALGRPRPRVLYVAGWGRSGSTLLARMLGEVPGFWFVGETRDIWLRGPVENRLCSCGVRFAECPFWTAVGESAFGGWSNVDVDEMLRLRRRTDRPWALPLALPRMRVPAYSKQARRYISILERLTHGLAEASGAKVLVDSSKLPSFAVLLSRVADADVRVVHLVRDSRGIAHSWATQKRREDSPDRVAFMLRYSAPAAATRYALYNTQAHLLQRAGFPYLFLRYEDMVTRPIEHVAAVIGHAGEPVSADALGFLGGDEIRLSPGHTISGNPMRMRSGRVRLAVDRRWVSNMDRRSRLAVTAITSPLLVRYGYPLRGHDD